MQMEKIVSVHEPESFNSEKIVFEKIDTLKFTVLFITSFGLYGLWWMYKSWKLFNDKDKIDIMPAMRTLFCVFYLSALFSMILDLAKMKGYSKSYSSILLFAGFIVFNLLGKLPEPYFLISFISISCLIAPFKALNYAVDYCDEIEVVNLRFFNIRQSLIIFLGGVFWILIIIGLCLK